MRKIEQQLKAAWEAGRARTIDNSRVEVEGPRVSLYLFGNEIARRYTDIPGLSLWTYAGWNKPTTRSRLRNVCGIGEQVLNNRMWYFYGSDPRTHPDGNGQPYSRAYSFSPDWRCFRQWAANQLEITLQAEPEPILIDGTGIDIGVY